MKVTRAPSPHSYLRVFLSLPWKKHNWTVFCTDTHSTLADSARQMGPGRFLLQAQKLPCEKPALTSDHICCLDGRNNCNLLCHCVDLIRQRTKALPLFWTSSRPMSSPWWYIIPLGRQVNYKLAPNTWRWRSPPSEGNVTVVVRLCVFMCVGSEEAGQHCYPNCQSHFQKSWWDTFGVHTSYAYTLACARTRCAHTAADAAKQTRWNYKQRRGAAHTVTQWKRHMDAATWHRLSPGIKLRSVSGHVIHIRTKKSMLMRGVNVAWWEWDQTYLRYQIFSWCKCNPHRAQHECRCLFLASIKYTLGCCTDLESKQERRPILLCALKAPKDLLLNWKKWKIKAIWVGMIYMKK